MSYRNSFIRISCSLLGAWLRGLRSIDTSGLWSFWTVIFLPKVIWSNRSNPNKIDMASFSIWAQFRSDGRKEQDAYSTGLPSWRITAPTASLLLSFFFFFFFLGGGGWGGGGGFTALSRIFHLYRAEKRRTRGKTTWPSVSRARLSHMWPELGSNHSVEKPNGLRVNSPIH